MWNELQAGLTAVGVFVSLLFFAGYLAVVIYRACADAFGKMRPDERKAFALFTAALAFYAGAKHIILPPDAGADEGYSVAEIVADYISSNDVTTVDVKFCGAGVTTNTPVSVRNSVSEEWRELAKSDAAITCDLPTNVLSFVVYGNAETNRYWWVGTDKPSIIVETTGIEIVYFLATSHSVQIAWTCDDPHATEFAIQRRLRGETWDTVAVTTDTAFEYIGFTVGESWEWRVISTYTEGEQ